MITKRQAISRVKKMFREVNADSRFTNKLAYSILDSAAKILIKRENDKMKLYSQSQLFQHYKCVDVIEAPTIDPCCGIKAYCKIWRTRERVPELYEDSTGPILKGVFTIDSSETIDYISSLDVLNLMKNPWRKKKDKKFVFFDDGYFYFPNGAYKKVDIFGYWKNVVVSNCDEENKNKCVRFLDQPFYIPGYLEKPVFELAQQEIANTYMKINEKSAQIDKNDNTFNIKS